MQLLISLWKKYYLIVFLDHGVLRSAKGEKNPWIEVILYLYSSQYLNLFLGFYKQLKYGTLKIS